ncbi:MAG: crossover junction endodeoxyribonuclease RuvC [Spirochaetes bacterium]|nr:crossover junction endodeoxyribonuclease RuvC [Spirochaetota bacterium]
MIIIGIDPGIEKTGIGIIQKEQQKLQLLDSVLIHTSAKLSHQQRLQNIFTELSTIVEKFPVEEAAVEKLFFAKNIKTALTVSEARGVILLALQLKKLPIYEYTPLQVKQALIGYGRATKKQIQELVKIILQLDEIPKQDDVADGIAVAITHIHSMKLKKKING